MTASLAVLVVVAAALAVYLTRCRRLRTEAGGDLKDLLKVFATDITDRAARGQDPDWPRYSEEGDRQHESLCEAMRNLATGSLATGIGGTMAMLLLHFWLGYGDAPADPSDPATEIATATATALPALFNAMGFALVASGMGVLTNLVILLVLLPSANRLFERRRAAFVGVLQQTSENHPPQNIATRLTGTMTERLDDVLRASAKSLPDVIRAFNDNVSDLGAIVERFQSSTDAMNSGVSALSASVSKLEALPSNLRDEFDAWQVQLQSVTSSLSASTDSLGSFPAALGDELSSARTAWSRAAADAQREHVVEFRSLIDAHASHMREALDMLEALKAGVAAAEERRRELWEEERSRHQSTMRDLSGSMSDIAAAAADLPKGFAEEIRQSADRLGREFGLRAQNQVGDLVAALRDQNESLGAAWERHVNRMFNEMAGIVHEGLKPTLEGISGIGADLEALGGQVSRAIGEFADHGKGFRDSLQGAAATIDDSSSRLADVHEVTRASVGEIRNRYEAMHAQLVDSLDRMEAISRARPGLIGRLRGWIGRGAGRSGKRTD